MAKIEFTNNIRRLRFENDEMSQQKLAGEAGCTRQTIIAIEQGKYNPSLALSFKISRAFGKKIEEVFVFSEKPTNKLG